MAIRKQRLHISVYANNKQHEMFLHTTFRWAYMKQSCTLNKAYIPIAESMFGVWCGFEFQMALMTRQ